MAAEAQTVTVPLIHKNKLTGADEPGGLVIIRAENMKESNARCSFIIKSEKMICKKKKMLGLYETEGPTHIQISRAQEREEDATYTYVHETKIGVDVRNRTWEPAFDIPMQKLCNLDEELKIKFTAFIKEKAICEGDITI